MIFSKIIEKYEMLCYNVLCLIIIAFVRLLKPAVGGSLMRVSYDKLWKLLIDNKMKKSDLAKAAQISQYTMTNLNNDRLVSMEIMLRLCKIFHCDIGDIMEVIEEE